jgi:hypothetical protein
VALFRTYRDVVLDGETASVVDQATLEHHRFDEAWRGLEWLLARTPEVGSKATINDVSWWLYVEQSDVVAGTPEIWVVYTADDNQVRIKGMRVTAYVPG